MKESEVNRCLHLAYRNLQLIDTVFFNSMITGMPLIKEICEKIQKDFVPSFTSRCLGLWHVQLGLGLIYLASAVAS